MTTQAQQEARAATGKKQGDNFAGDRTLERAIPPADTITREEYRRQLAAETAEEAERVRRHGGKVNRPGGRTAGHR